MGLPMKNFMKIKDLPLKSAIVFYSTPEEILNFHNILLKNFIGPQKGDTDVKCNSPQYVVGKIYS